MEDGEIRCKRCKQLLARGSVKDGQLEVKCRRCHYVNRFEFPRQPQEVATAESAT